MMPRASSPSDCTTDRCVWRGCRDLVKEQNRQNEILADDARKFTGICDNGITVIMILSESYGSS